MLFSIMAVGGSLHGVVRPSRDKMVREASAEEAVGKSFGFVLMGIPSGSIAAALTLCFILDTGQTRLVFWATSGSILIAVLTRLPKDAKAK